LTRDPLRPGLSLRQRRDRVMAALSAALNALDACGAGQPQADKAFHPLRAEAIPLEAALSLQRIRRAPETIDTALTLIYRMEQQAAASCGQGSALDRALLIIGRRHEADRQ
jgi:hypothetical protein